MKRHVYTIIAFFCVFFIFGFSANYASAADATRIYLELSSSSALVLPVYQGRDYLRGRVTFLDANNQLATTFNGVAIEDAEIIFQSTYGSLARFSRRPATDLALTGSDWETAAAEVTVSPEKAWQEFAVSFDDITLSGTDTITVTLKQGGETLVDQRTVEVKGPEANCYIVRTGGGLSVALYDDIPGQQNDRGNVKTSGDTTTVDVYAAFYYTDDSGTQHYVYTDNVPAEALSPSVGDTDFTLTNGHAQQSVSKDAAADSSSASAFNNSFDTGTSQTFSASLDSKATCWVGNSSGDVTEEEYLNITKSSSSFDEAGSSDEKNDTSTYKAVGTVSRITIIGLPVNQVDENGTHSEAGFDDQNVDPGQLTPHPNDALKLLDDPTEKPTKFRVAGRENETFIYGAIVGFDADGNPAPFAQGITATFYLGKEEGIAVNSSTPELYSVSPTYSPTEGSVNTSGMITATFAYQWFLPFRIPAVADDGTPSIENLYIRNIGLWNGSSYSSYPNPSVFENIDTAGEGVDFIAQDFIVAVDVTDVATLDEKTAGEDAEVTITGTDDESSFQLKVLDDGGGAVSIGYKDTADPLTWVQVPEDEDNTAVQDMALFSSLAAKDLFFIVKGETNHTYANTYFDNGGDGLTVVAADADDYEPTAISSAYSEINVLLDDEEDHNTVALRDGVITVKDVFSNSYGVTGATLQDAKIQASVYVPSDNGSASGTAFPGSSTKVDENSVEVKFNLDDVTAGSDSAVLELSTQHGGATAQAMMYLKTLKKISVDKVFVPIPGIDDTPLEVSFLDQDGGQIAPVTVTAANAPGNDESQGNVIDVELSADNGTVTGGETIQLKTVSPRKVISADPGDKTRMTVTVETRDYGTDTLALVFEPDLTPPYVGDITTDNCQVAIEIVDNSAVDLQETEVSIKNNTGEDITAQLERTHVDNGTSGTIVFTSSPGEGFGEGEDLVYTADITPKDEWLNERAAVERIFSLTCEPGPEPLCLSVEPSEGDTGDNMTVTITAQDANFVQGLTEVSFGCDNQTVRVQAVRVMSETELEVDISIGGGDTQQDDGGDNGTDIPSNGEEVTGTRVYVSSFAAQVSPTTTVPTTTTITPLEGSSCDITITTGDEILICEQAFTVYDVSSGKCLDIIPAAVDSADSTTLFVTGEGLNFGSMTPDQVHFDCGDITVNAVSGSGNQLLVDITSNAVDETVTCSMTLTAREIECGQVTIKPLGNSRISRLIGISRQVVRAGVVFPRFYVVTIRGNDMCSFDSRPDVKFGTDSITASPILWFGNTVVCVIRVDPKTTPHTYNVTVDGVAGVTLTVD